VVRSRYLRNAIRPNGSFYCEYPNLVRSRFNVFSDIAKRLDLGCNKLILDVPTRWNNTYLMLETAIRFKEVFPRYHRV
jgi:hypothetical protein